MTEIISRIRFFPGREIVDGLAPFAMDRLGEVVVLAGPNGSGKTRILRAIAKGLVGHDKKREEIADLEKQIAILESPDNPTKGSPSAKTIIDQSSQQLTNLVQIDLRRSYPSDEPNVLEISPLASLNFEDPDQIAELKRREIKERLHYRYNYVPPFEEALVRLDIAVHDSFIASHQDSLLTGEEKQRRLSRYNDLKRTILDTVGVHLHSSHEFHATINGLPLFKGTENFSNGQKKLVDFISALSQPAGVTKDVVVLMDEPELYIHPGALIQMLDRLRDAFPKSQLFVATHCVPLIAHLGHDNVWWVSSGKASWSGRNTQQVLEGLLGGHENVLKVRELTQEPHRLATITYAYEALFRPDVVAATKRDPQGRQITNAVRELRDRVGRPIRLLDFGAGKGRLVSALTEDFGSRTREYVDYVAFEQPDSPHKEECEASIARAFGTADGRFFDKTAKLMDKYGRNYFDKALLCNVLHEISPKDWIETFNFLSGSVFKEGSVLIVEDSQIPHGELAHSQGFIITDARALKMIFKMDQLPETIPPEDKKYTDRLFAYLIPHAALNMIDTASVKEAMQWCNDQSLRRIIDLRKSARDKYEDGIIHGLLTQQFVNTSIAIKSL